MRWLVYSAWCLMPLALCATDARLRVPIGLCDPSAVPPPRAVSNQNEIATFFVPEETESYTFLVWHRSIAPGADYRFIKWDITTEAARATREGGPELAAVRDYAPITLSAGGTWSMSGLPDTYDMPTGSAMTDKWQYGCFCVNVLTQTPLTITVAGTEKQVPASNEKQIFNILGTAADRTVTVAASDPSAPVDFGIGVNPLKQFFGTLVQPQQTSSPAEFATYSVSNECAFSVVRAAITNSGTQVHWKAWRRTARGGEFAMEATENLWKSRATFEKNARAMITWCGFTIGYCATEVYGAKYFPRWISNAEIDRIYEADLEVIRARHLMGE